MKLKTFSSSLTVVLMELANNRVMDELELDCHKEELMFAVRALTPSVSMAQKIFYDGRLSKMN